MRAPDASISDASRGAVILMNAEQGPETIEEPGLLSVLIPVLNEAATLERVIDELERLTLPIEIIVADDGSTDGSREIVERLGAAGRVRPVLDGETGGKGLAVRRALARARGEFVIIQDADMEYFPDDIPRVLEPIFAGRLDVCYGSRILGAPHNWWSPFYWGGRLVSLVTMLLFARRVTDEPTCYKAFRRRDLLALGGEGRGFDWEPEITAKALRRGLRYGEVPIDYRPRSLAEGKKISWRDGVRAVIVLLRWRFRRLERDAS